MRGPLHRGEIPVSVTRAPAGAGRSLGGSRPPCSLFTKREPSKGASLAPSGQFTFRAAGRSKREKRKTDRRTVRSACLWLRGSCESACPGPRPRRPCAFHRRSKSCAPAQRGSTGCASKETAPVFAAAGLATIERRAGRRRGPRKSVPRRPLIRRCAPASPRGEAFIWEKAPAAVAQPGPYLARETVSRVLYLTVIYLDAPLPVRSSHLLRTAGPAICPFHGVAPDRVYSDGHSRAVGCALTAPFHPYQGG